MHRNWLETISIFRIYFKISLKTSFYMEDALRNTETRKTQNILSALPEVTTPT